MAPPQLKIPVRLVKPYLNKYLEHCEQQTLAERAGVPERSLHRILYEQENVTWTMVDKLFCTMGDPFIWYADPRLREIYESISPDPLENVPPGDCKYGHPRKIHGYRVKKQLRCRECDRERSRARNARLKRDRAEAKAA